MLISGTVISLAGLSDHYPKGEGEQLSLLDSVLLWLAACDCVLLLLGIPYAYFQLARLGSAEGQSKGKDIKI